MTDKIKLLEEIIENCTDKYGDNRIKIAKALFLLNEIKADINYTRCCTELCDDKDKVFICENETCMMRKCNECGDIA
jgi:hypothetical protein